MNPRAGYSCGINDLIVAGKITALKANYFYDQTQKQKLELLAPYVLANKMDEFKAANFYDMQQAQKLHLLSPLVLANKMTEFKAANFYDMQQVQNIHRAIPMILSGSMTEFQAANNNHQHNTYCTNTTMPFGGSMFGSYQQPGHSSSGYTSSQQQTQQKFNSGYSSSRRLG